MILRAFKSQKTSNGLVLWTSCPTPPLEPFTNSKMIRSGRNVEKLYISLSRCIENKKGAPSGVFLYSFWGKPKTTASSHVQMKLKRVFICGWGPQTPSTMGQKPLFSNAVLAIILFIPLEFLSFSFLECKLKKIVCTTLSLQVRG